MYRIHILMKDSYHTEYIMLLKQAIDYYISEYKDMMIFDGMNIADAVKLVLIKNLSEEECHYAQCRNNGKNKYEAMERIYSCLELFSDKRCKEKIVSHSINQEWHRLLIDFEHCTLIYSDNASRIIELVPQIRETAGIKVLLSLDEMDDSTEFSEDCVAIKLENTTIMKDSNPFLRTNFPYIHQIANSISWLLSILKSKAIINFSSQTIAGVVLSRLALASDIDIYDK